MLNLYKNLVRPIAFYGDAEKIHELGLRSLRFGLSSESMQRIARSRYLVDGLEPIKLFGLEFPNPVGIAAGFDKNGLVVDQLAALGFGFVEVGTATAEAQPGNDKPRMFRLPSDNAIINRLGFNNRGTKLLAVNLKKSNGRCIVGVNIGKNKDVSNEEAIPNYLKALDDVVEIADYIAVNVSSPNTPDLRALQETAKLDQLLGAIQARLQDHSAQDKPLLLKIAPDLKFDEIDGIVDICRSRSIDGIIATNTTISRENLRTDSGSVTKYGDGGLSGRPLQEKANSVIRRLYQQAEGELPIIGVGGVFDAHDAFRKISLGASLVQGYTGFIYRGPGYARDINRGLIQILESKGLKSIEEAVGCAI